MDINLKEKSPEKRKIVRNPKMLHGIQEGDIIYVTDLTRITRSTKDLFELIDNIRSKRQI